MVRYYYMNIINRVGSCIVGCVMLLQVGVPVLVLAEDLPATASSEVVSAVPVPSGTTTTSTTSVYSTPSLGNGVAQLPPNTVDCFQYYTFGSVAVDVEPVVQSGVAGSALTFTGIITNTNDYPIIDGQVMVKVFKTSGLDETDVHGNGYPVVEQFFPQEHVTLPAHGTTSISFDWEVPAYTTSGEYELDTFFMTDRRFNLLGLPFTDDITGNKAGFSIVGQTEKAVSFNKYSVKLNNETYHFAAFPPVFEKDEPVTATAELVNTTTETQIVPVQWNLFDWAGERIENQLAVKTDSVLLKPGEKKVVTYTATKAVGSVSLLQAVATFKDTKSILNIRFARNGFDQIRLNFPSTATYPLSAGKEATIFSCVHSTMAPIVTDGKLTLSILTPEGQLIHAYTYDGQVTGDMMGVKDTYTPTTTIADFDVRAELWRQGEKVEEVTIPYRCKDINPSLCSASTTPDIPKVASNPSSKNLPMWVGGIFAAILILVIIVIGWYRGRKHHNDSIEPPFGGDSISSLLLLLAVVSGVWLSVLPAPAFALSTQYSAGGIPALYHYYQWDDGLFDNRDHYWNYGITPGSASVTYRATLVDVATNVTIPSDTSVEVGTKIKVLHTPYQSTDIHWVGTGYSFDSPYGHWKANAERTAFNYGDFVGVDSSGNGCHGNTAWIYVPFVVNPPVPAVVNPSSNVSCNGIICTVTAPGPVSVSMQFPATYGQFYFTYAATTFSKMRFCPVNIEHRHIGDPGDNRPYWPMSADGSNNNSQHEPYKFIVPTQIIAFNLQAVNPSNPPKDPQVTPRVHNSRLIEEKQYFDLTTTEPDGEQVRYGVDWDNNGSPDYWTGFVDAVASTPVRHIWITPGTYTFRVIAEDTSKARSHWVNANITIDKRPPTVALGLSDCPAGIAKDQSTCSGRVNWVFTNADGPYLVKNAGGTALGTAVSGDMATTFHYGDNTVLALDNGIALDTRTITVRCADGLIWSDGVCMENHLPSLSLRAMSALIRTGTSTVLKWNISDMTKNTCTIQGPGISTPVVVSTPTGQLTVGPLTAVSTFTLTCRSPLHPDVSTSAVVEVVPGVKEN